MRVLRCVAVAAALLGAPPGVTASVHAPCSTPPDLRATATPPSSAYGRLPLHFEANRGQTDPSVGFVVRPRGYVAFLLPSEVVFALPARETAKPAASCGADDALDTALSTDVIRMSFRGTSSPARLAGRERLEGKSHYFRGSESDGWVTDVPHFGRAVVDDLYPGVALHWRGGSGSALAYDFVVAPGADPARIALRFEGAETIEIASDGGLVVRTKRCVLRQTRPILYQERAGTRRSVRGGFVLGDDATVGFEVGAYDPAQPLVIDPEFRYSTYLGGGRADHGGMSIAVDSSGSAYVVGRVVSTDFPTKAALQKGHGDGGTPGEDAAVCKLNPAGTALVYSTYLGGVGIDHAMGVAVDSKGAAYVVGWTKSSGFPTKSPLQATRSSGEDGFLTKLNPQGSALVYSTYHGGSGNDRAHDVAVDSNGAAYVTGHTASTNLPTKSPLQAKYGGGKFDVFVSKFNAAGSALVYSSYHGGSGEDSYPSIAVDGTGAAYVAGQTDSTDFPTKSPRQSTNAGARDVFVSKFNAAGSALVYSTYHGGTGEDNGAAIAVDGVGAAYVSGGTTSTTSYPLHSPYQATHGGLFLAKFKPDGSALAYSTHLGRGGIGRIGGGRGIAVDSTGAAYTVAHTTAPDFPMKEAVQPIYGGANNGWGDLVVAVLNPAGSALLFSTYVGGSEEEVAKAIAVDSRGDIYVAGHQWDGDYPTVNAVQSSNAGQGDWIVTKIGARFVPAKPVDLVVTSATEEQVDLAWADKSTRENDFELERAAADGAFEALASVDIDVTVYSDATVTADTTYTYRVRAANETGQSPWSNEVVAVTIASPDELMGDAVSNTRVDLMWRDRSGIEDGFEVERKRAGDDDPLALGTVAAGVTSFADKAAEPETTYFYRVRATKGTAASGWSRVVEVTTPPADPKDVVPSNQTDAAVLVRWTDLSAAEAGYEVERGVGCPAASYSRLATVGPDVAEFLDRDPQPETTYAYRVRAVNEHGHSEYTAPVCITTAPSAPTGFAGNAMSPSRIRLTWSDNSGVEKGYEVQRTVAGREEWEDTADLPADSSEYLDVGVSQEAAFSYRVRAYDDNGRSRNALAEGVSTPAALVVRVAKLTIPTGRAAKRKKPTLIARGEMDVGGTQVDLEGAATLWIGDVQIDVASFVALRRGKLLRYDQDGIRLDLEPSGKGASRVPFALRVVGDVAAALDKDGELFLRFRSGAFDAMGVVTLAGGSFNPARGKGTWIDPELNLLSVAATPKRKSFRMKATFPPGELPETAPEVSVLLDIFEISFEPGAFKKRGATKYVLSRRLGPVRQKVILDYRRGTLTIALSGVVVQTYEPGTVLVSLGVSIGETQLQDKPMLVVTKRSFRY